ncbi:hypothetical protein AB0H77_22035 [Streptomyces sp. NPDC050844]|uniref:hypothetical protein n=1 Tax=Streptomyces sp. NPDC050844 TaxID=3155790 RepID=UPI0033FEE680
MAPTTRTTPERDAGDAWLASCAPDPNAAYEAWEMGALATIHSTRWLVAETQLAHALEAIKRIPDHQQGPVLIDVRFDRAWWLVPLDAAEQLADVRPVTVLPFEWPLHCPPTSRAFGSRVWLEAPDGSGRVMNPIYLAAALGPGGGPRLPAEAFG